MSITEVDSQEVRDIARGESILFSACFGPSLFGDTLATVAGVTQTSGSGTLTLSSGAINTGGAVSVDGVSRPINTVAQYRVTVGSSVAVGLYVVTVTCTTANGNTRSMRCQFRVV